VRTEDERILKEDSRQEQNADDGYSVILVSARLDDSEYYRWTQQGQHPQDSTNLLQGQGVPKAHPPQGHPVQGGKGLDRCPGKATIRPQAERLRWSDQARTWCVDERGRIGADGALITGFPQEG
jgi:hypothetical protein